MDVLAAHYKALEDTDSSDAESTSKPQGGGETSGMTQESHGEPGSAASTHKRAKLDSAPDVSVEVMSRQVAPLVSPSTQEIKVNLTYSDLTRQLQGPANPFTNRFVESQNMLTGHVQQQTVADFDFAMQERTFRAFGYARDPSSSSVASNGGVGQGIGGTGYVGNVQKALETGGAMVRDPKAPKNNQSFKRKPKGDLSVLEGENAYMGPWAGYEQDDIAEAVEPETIPEEEAATAKAGASKGRRAGAGNERTIFHGKEEADYLGRTYMHVPQDVGVNLDADPGEHECFIPKQLVHTWTGHSKGVSAIRFIPGSGHLILSGSMDTKVKLWDVYHDRQCLRTYLGHSKAVRDICFSNDGRRFLSASYDKYIKLWDTETGKCIGAFTNRKIPYCVTFHPDNDKQHIFLTGCSDKKIVQYDINTGEITQEYDQHLGAVNTITFVDENRRFVTTSDDKTLRAWEFDIPVVIKYIAEPHMHSMPSVAVHPNKKWIACQSLDNQIVIYGAGDRFRLNRKKRFAGHVVAGYACQVNFSPDGRFVMSGDGSGHVWFWDWKTCRILRKLKAHDQVAIGCAWHPHEPSKVATCSWDGTIKYWD